MKHYQDYVWKEGFPYGIHPTTATGTSYKIVSDPYNKRVSIEEYQGDDLQRVVYDSALFDFRTLTPAHQTAWEKSVLLRSENTERCLIRNQDDRAVLIEEYTFEGNRCRSCRSFSPHSILISLQSMYYTALGDSFDGVILFDANNKAVMCKKYAVDQESGEFSALLQENWCLRV